MHWLFADSTANDVISPAYDPSYCQRGDAPPPPATSASSPGPPPPAPPPAHPHLVRGETLHVRHADDVLQVLVQVVHVGVDRHLVLPLELGPHLAELRVGARRRHDVVHDVDVDVVEHDAVTVGAGAAHVVHCQHAARTSYTVNMAQCGSVNMRHQQCQHADVVHRTRHRSERTVSAMSAWRSVNVSWHTLCTKRSIGTSQRSLNTALSRASTSPSVASTSVSSSLIALSTSPHVNIGDNSQRAMSTKRQRS